MPTFGLVTIDQVVPFQCSTNVLLVAPGWSKVWPTALQFVVLGHDTLSRPLEVTPLGLGLATIDQLVPFHRSTKVAPADPSGEEPPTASQFVVLTHDTPLRSVSREPVGSGLVTTDHVVPFQCSANACALESMLTSYPTALQIVVLGHDTLARLFTPN